MIEKDQIPLEAVFPTEAQWSFLSRLVAETTNYARSKNYSDMYFQGHSDQSYFGAYSSKIVRRGAGLFVFGFDRRGGVLRFAFPIDLDEPYRLAKSWIADPTRNRAIIELEDNPSDEIQLYLTNLAKRSIDYHYKTE